MTTFKNLPYHAMLKLWTRNMQMTNMYRKSILENLESVKVALEVFLLVLGTKINWHKLKAIWMLYDPRSFQWGKDMELVWLQYGKISRYLGFQIGFEVTPELCLEAVLQMLKKKLTY